MVLVPVLLLFAITKCCTLYRLSATRATPIPPFSRLYTLTSTLIAMKLYSTSDEQERSVSEFLGSKG